MLAEANLEELEVRLLLQAIQEKYGYHFVDYAQSSMRRRVRTALTRSGLSHLGELQHKILLDPIFFASILDDLTVRVSEMFRDPPFFRTFRERVVPILRTYPLLKIWHAGCASGEEVYTTAILLAEENLYERAQIYATDMSPKALELARAGVYPEERAPEFERNYLEGGGKQRLGAYFSHAYGRVVVREALRRNVVFFQHDLASDHALGEMHVVFCRNVLIYFGSQLRDRVLSTFAGCLERAGFLCLGMNEGLSPLARDSFADFSERERIFRRRTT
ncbi:MAG TPA: protein-glutamate O-methyltransferase CheR [Polyangiaceae bacterium]|nr:protein-glutamate O-methyltransferase CheR [Polyangiaceae bacterium]